jgi:steroid 5-alpha reductase family enzyme
MNDVIMLLGANFIMLIGVMLVLWAVSIPLKDVSFIDSFWAFGFILVAGLSFVLTPDGAADRRILLLVLTLVWGLRLGGYLFWRWRKEGPDKRYLALLKHAKPGTEHWHSFKYVFMMQAVLLWVVSLPVQLGQIAPSPAELGQLAFAGAALAVIGIFFESVGDWQMARFKADPQSAGKVMDKGLWRYTRHPNYFGDACVWWGLYLIAAETRPGWAAILGPIVLTALLVKWSGAALLERRLKRSRPDYDAYIARTSGFIPMPPKSGDLS